MRNATSRLFLLACALGTVMLLSGCGGSDDPSPDGLTMQQARSQAMGTVVDTSDQLYQAMSRTISDSGMPALPGIPQDNGQQLITDLDVLLEVLLDSPERQGDTIVYQPNPDVLCHDAENALGRLYCEVLLQRFSIVQTPQTALRGTLALYFEEWKALTLGYGPDSFFLELDLAESKSALLAFARFIGEDELNDELPYTFEGRVRLSLAQFGEQAGELLLTIPQDLRIAGYVNEAEEQGFYDFWVEATDVAIRITADVIAETAEIELGLGIVDIELTDLSQDEPVFFEANMEQFTGELVFDGASESAQISSLGLGDAPMRISLNKSQIIDLSLPLFSVAIDGWHNTLSFDDSDLNIELAVSLNDIADLIFGVEVPDWPEQLNGTMTLDIVQSSVFKVYEQSDADSDILQVLAGSVNGSGSGLFSAGVPFEAVKDDCFTGYENDSDQPAFPFVLLDCPLVE